MDGLTHINIYSKGQTTIGRWLSNFTYAPFNCEDGHFKSIEGYWYWLGCQDPRLTQAVGYNAKKIGREVPRTILLPEAEFRRKILTAIELKLDANPDMKAKFISSSLPFEHYYMYGDKKVTPKGLEWLIEGIEILREMLWRIDSK